MADAVTVTPPTSPPVLAKAHLDTHARLQLAAALLEYDHDEDGKLAEHSAIFAPYRDCSYPTQIAGQSGTLPSTTGTAALFPTYPSQPPLEDANVQRDSDSLDAGSFVGVGTHYAQASVHGRLSTFLGQASEFAALTPHAPPDTYSAAPSTILPLPGTVDNVDYEQQYDESSMSRQSAEGHAADAAAEHPSSEPEDLASQWGLESVMTKYDNFTSADLLRKNGRDPVSPSFAPELAARPGTMMEVHAHEEGEESLLAKSTRGRSKSLGAIEAMASQVPFLSETGGHLEGPEDAQEEIELDFEAAKQAAKKHGRRLRTTSEGRPFSTFSSGDASHPGHLSKAGTRTRASIDLMSEMDAAFGQAREETVEQGEGATRSVGGRSRSSSFALSNFGGLANANPEETSAAYAAEAAARPPSSLEYHPDLIPGGATGSQAYVSRFDPKAVAAAKQEAESGRPRFTSSLHPKILIMPAPLADLVEEKSDARDEKDGQAATALSDAAPAGGEKPRKEREAGKLYGRSLMDELQERKARQKNKQKVFSGDGRRAMMDYGQALGQQNGLLRSGGGLIAQIRSPSPLGSPAIIEDKVNDKEPWKRFTSQFNLASQLHDLKTADGADTNVSPQRRVSTLLTPDRVADSVSTPEISPRKSIFLQHTLDPADAANHGYGHSRHMSTMDLAKVGSSQILPQADRKELSDDSEDDDQPLQARQSKLVTSASQGQLLPASQARVGEETVGRPGLPASTSVFGVDLVLQRELAKLDKILVIEEAERKIAAERQRIKDAERDAKENKRREKEEKKARKKKERDQALGKSVGVLDEAKEKRKSQNLQKYLEAQQAIHDPAFPSRRSRQNTEEHLAEHNFEEYAGYETTQVPMPDLEGDEDGGEMLPLPGESIVTSSGSRSRPRTHSQAPSLDLSFLSTNPLAPDDTDKPFSRDEDGEGSHMSRWFGDARSQSSSASQRSDDDDAGQRLKPVKVSMDSFVFSGTRSSDGEEDAEEEELAASRRQASAERRPMYKRVARADSLAGVLESFGIGEPTDTNEEGRELAQRCSIEDDEEDDARPLSTMLLGKKLVDTPPRIAGGEADSEEEEEQPIAMARLSATNHLALAPSDALPSPANLTIPDPPQSDIPIDLSTTAVDAEALHGQSEEDDDADDDAPLALKKLGIDGIRGAARAEQTGSNSSSEDDVPLGLRGQDDAPLGRAHPQAALQQAQEKNAYLMAQAQMQLQLQMQYQYQMQQAQVLAAQQWQGSMLDVPQMHPAPPHMSVGYQPSISAGGAYSPMGSDVGLPGQPADPRLVTSVDRWRQGVE